MTVHRYDYNIAEHYLPALINDDWTGLDDDEHSRLEVFLGVTYADAAMQGKRALPVYWHISDDEPSFSRCDVSNLMAMCVPATLVVTHQDK